MIRWIRPALVICCTLVMLYTNLLGGDGSGFTEDSANPGMYYQYLTPLSPAPFTFVIWLPLFAGCCSIAIYQALPSQIDDSTVDAFALPYCCALLANAATPFLRIGWSNLVVTALFVLLCLAVIVTTKNRTHSLAETWGFRIPLLAFTTWCGVAAVVNLCQWLASRGAPVSAAFTIGLVCLVMGLGLLALWATKEPVIACVMLWAGVGIIFAQPGWNGVSFAVAATSACTLVCGLWVSRAYGRTAAFDQ